MATRKQSRNQQVRKTPSQSIPDAGSARPDGVPAADDLLSDPDDPVPVSLVSAVAVVALAAGSLLSVAVYRGGRKV